MFRKTLLPWPPIYSRIAYCYCTLRGAISQPANGNSPRKNKKGEKMVFPNFPPSIFYLIFVQIAILCGEIIGDFSAKLLSIFLTIHWKFALGSVIMYCANTKPLCCKTRYRFWEVSMSKKFLYLFKEGHDAFGG